MKTNGIYTSKTASMLINMPYTQEPNSAELASESRNGILIGSSYKMNVPIFLNFDSLFNPHIFIVGMTGSGKTYLMKSLLIKLHMVLDTAVIIIDLTGEYLEIADSIGAEHANMAELQKHESMDLSETIYFGLNEMKEEEKVSNSSKILRMIASSMRKNVERRQKQVSVLLDESWKLLGKNDDLEIIVREGRKYGVGLLLASQLLEDMKSEIVSNSASIFIFRVQVKKSAENIAANYSLGQEYIDMIQELNQGSCLFIKLGKGNKRAITVIKRVSGIAINPKKGIRIGGKMEIEMDTERLQAMVNRLCATDEGKMIMSYVGSKQGLRLSELISELIAHGADRRAVLSELRKLKINDADLADAFSDAVSSISKGAVNEK